MMIKKKIGVLAAAVAVASSAQAAFDQGNAVLFAHNAANDNTYFIDLGVTAQDLANGATVVTNSAGLASWLAGNAGATWTVVGTINDPTAVGGPPAAGQSLANSGIVGSSASGAPVGLTGSDNEAQKAVLNAWLADVQTASGGASEFQLPGTDPASADVNRNAGFLNNSTAAFDTATDLFYAQANPADGGLLSDPTVVTAVGLLGDNSSAIFSNGDININVPVPAAAWLFGSALAGLTVLRRRK